MSKYVRLTKTVNNKGKLVKPEEVQSLIKDDADYYSSTYYYDDNHYKTFQETGSIKGIKDVKTDKIWFDFDTKDGTLEDSRKDAVSLVNRLKQHYKVDADKLEIYFSGNKGFNVILNLNREITPQQVKHIAINKFATDLATFDSSLYDESQIIRVPRTKHQDSGLYKIPLTLNQLENLSIDQIKDKAKSNSVLGKFKYEKVDLDENIFELEEVKKEIRETVVDSFNLKNRPKGWKASKWALVQGEMQRGERDTGCLVILATCRALGYDMITAYYLAKGALKRAHEKYGEGTFTKEDLWKKAERVYGPEWQGGAFTSENEPLLQKVCERLDLKDESPKALTLGVDDLLNQTLSFAQNIDSLTIKSGIEPLDNRLRMTVGMSVGLIAPPGAGKTSLALQMLNHMSKENVQSIFFSYDMYAALVGIKMIQKHKGKDFESVMKLLKTNNAEFNAQVKEIMRTEYANVEFCFQNGQTVADIEETIKYVKEKKGKDVKFIVLDYNELIMTEFSDPTHSSLFVAQKIRQIAIEHNLCALSLFQPSKISGDPSHEITSYRSAKGSSAIEQSLSIILGLSRPGCTPEMSDQNYDQFAVINCLKNRFGGLFRLDLVWDPIQGTVRKHNSETMALYNELKELIAKKKEAQDEW